MRRDATGQRLTALDGLLRAGTGWQIAEKGLATDGHGLKTNN
jgi:hypothetical protein